MQINDENKPISMVLDIFIIRYRACAGSMPAPAEFKTPVVSMKLLWDMKWTDPLNEHLNWEKTLQVLGSEGVGVEDKRW